MWTLLERQRGGSLSLKGIGILTPCIFWGSWIESEFHSEHILLRSTLFHDLGSLRGPGPFLRGVTWFRSTMGHKYSYLNFLGLGKDSPFLGNIFWKATPLRFWSWSMSSTGRIFPSMGRVWHCHLVCSLDLVYCAPSEPLDNFT